MSRDPRSISEGTDSYSDLAYRRAGISTISSKLSARDRSDTQHLPLPADRGEQEQIDCGLLSLDEYDDSD